MLISNRINSIKNGVWLKCAQMESILMQLEWNLKKVWIDWNKQNYFQKWI